MKRFLPSAQKGWLGLSLLTVCALFAWSAVAWQIARSQPDHAFVALGDDQLRERTGAQTTAGPRCRTVPACDLKNELCWTGEICTFRDGQLRCPIHPRNGDVKIQKKYDGPLYCKTPIYILAGTECTQGSAISIICNTKQTCVCKPVAGQTHKVCRPDPEDEDVSLSNPNHVTCVSRDAGDPIVCTVKLCP